MKGIQYYFTAPFLPRRTFIQFADAENSKRLFVIVLFIHLVLVSLLTWFSGKVPPPRFDEMEKGVFLFGFVLGVVGRTFIMAYILWICVKKVFQKNLPYQLCANIVLITLLPLSGQAILNLVVSSNYGAGWWLGMIYSSILITMAFSILTKVSFSKMLVLVLLSHLILWIMIVPFTGIDI